MGIGRYVAQRAGIGINAAESVASTVRSEVEKSRTQVLFRSQKVWEHRPMLHSKWHSRWSATVHFPIWYQEIEDIIVLKNNKGTQDNRVRKLDYSIQIVNCSMNVSSKTKRPALLTSRCTRSLWCFGTWFWWSLYRLWIWWIYSTQLSVLKNLLDSWKRSRDWSCLPHEHWPLQ